MGAVGWAEVVDQSNTTTGEATETVAGAATGIPLGKSVAGKGVVNTYGFYGPSLDLDFVSQNYMVWSIGPTDGPSLDLNFTSQTYASWAINPSYG